MGQVSNFYQLSSRRFVLYAKKDLGKKVAVVNIGPTRADPLVDLKVDAKASDVLNNISI